MKCHRLLHPDVYLITLLIVLIIGIVSACNPQTDETLVTSEPSISLPPPTGTSTATSSSSPTTNSTLPPTLTATQTNTPIPTFSPTAVCLRVLNPPDEIQYPELGEVKFEWETVTGAAKYRLEMVTPMDTTIVFETFLTSVNRYLIMYPWGGTYTWKLSAIGSDGQAICVAGPFNFTKLAYVITEKPGEIKSFRRPDENCG